MGRVDFRTVIEERVSRGQSPLNLVRMPAQVHSPGLFELSGGEIIDLRRTTFLHRTAVPGLVKLARRGPVQIRLTKGSQPLGKLQELLPGCLRSSLADSDEWELVCPE